MYTKPVYSTCIHKTRKEYTFYLFVRKLSNIEKLVAQKYSFMLIYKHLTWAAPCTACYNLIFLCHTRTSCNVRQIVIKLRVTLKWAVTTSVRTLGADHCSMKCPPVSAQSQFRALIKGHGAWSLCSCDHCSAVTMIHLTVDTAWLRVDQLTQMCTWPKENTRGSLL